MPLSVLHGEKDLDVPVVQANNLKKLVEETKNPHVSITIDPEADHGFSYSEFVMVQHIDNFFQRIFYKHH